jgi:hypothetical protein
MKASAFRAPGERRLAVKPARLATLGPEHFADTWSGKAKGAVCVGLRRLSELDEQSVYREATREAEAAMQDAPDPEKEARFVETFNDAVLRIGVGRCLCDPNDVSQPHETFPVAEDMVGHALTHEAILGLFEQVKAVTVQTSPLYREASDDELQELAWAILDGRVGELPPLQQATARRFAGYVLDDLGAVKEDLGLDT